MAKKKKKSLDPLEAIKRLIILWFLKNKITSGEIGKVLGVDSSVIRHAVPIRKSKKRKGKKSKKSKKK